MTDLAPGPRERALVYVMVIPWTTPGLSLGTEAVRSPRSRRVRQACPLVPSPQTPARPCRPPCAVPSLHAGLPRPGTCVWPRCRADPAPASSPALGGFGPSGVGARRTQLADGAGPVWAHGWLGSHRPFFLDSASFAPNVLRASDSASCDDCAL